MEIKLERKPTLMVPSNVGVIGGSLLGLEECLAKKVLPASSQRDKKSPASTAESAAFPNDQLEVPSLTL